MPRNGYGLKKEPKVTVKKYKRTADPAGTDPGAAAEIEDIAKRKRALSGLEPTRPKLGSPADLIPSAEQLRAVVKRATPRTTHTPAEEETFKLRGQRAFYEGKLERQQPTRTMEGNRGGFAGFDDAWAQATERFRKRNKPKKGY